MPTELRTAATVLVMRDAPGGPEVFMVRRHGGAAFMAGAHVFPGGAVDAADRDTTAAAWCDGVDHASLQLTDLAPAESLAFHIAAARELFEEAGVLLARDRTGGFVRFLDEAARDRFAQYRQHVHAGTTTLRAVLGQEGLRLAADALVVCAHWVTPPVDTRRFDTRFFVTSLPADQHPVHDDRETTGSLWLRPADAIAAAQRREIILPPPTWMMLRELGPLESTEAVLQWARGRRVRRREPAQSSVDGVRALIMHDGGGAETARPEDWFLWREDRWMPGGGR